METMMANRRKAELVKCTYFAWRLRQRGEIWYADGRGNRPNPGRWSLETNDYEAALKNLEQLDRLRAVDFGLADASLLTGKQDKTLTLEEGRDAYFTYLRRPRVAGGASAATVKRYTAVFDKFIPVAKEAGLHCWNRIKRHHLDVYAAWLDGESYAYATEFLELTCIKQVVNYLIEAELLPIECKLRYKLAKPSGTTTYSYLETEVTAMLDHCQANAELHWLRNVIAALAFTGMRISELTGLRQGDVDFTLNVITLVDERYRTQSVGGKLRTIKNRRSRTFPIHESLRPILAALLMAGTNRPVFVGPNEDKLKPDDVLKSLKRDVIKPLSNRFPSAADEIGFKDGRLHSFRHYFCSLCANSGVSELAVMNWLGHGSSLMVKHYYHLHDQESQRQMSKVKTGWSPEQPG